MDKRQQLVYDTLALKFDFPQKKLDQIVLWGNRVMALTRKPNIYKTQIAEYKLFNGLPYPLFRWMDPEYQDNIDKHFDTGSKGQLIPNFQLTLGSGDLPELMFRGKNASVELRDFVKAMDRSTQHMPEDARPIFLSLYDDDSNWFSIRFRRIGTALGFIDYLNDRFVPPKQ